MNDKMQAISRGDIFYADLSPVVGCEQGGTRPVLVLQNDIGNRYSPTVIVCAITGKPKKPLPTHAVIASASRLSRESFALLEQIRTIDRIRLREWIGRLDVHEMEKNRSGTFYQRRTCSGAILIWEGSTMTNAQVSDNLMFVAALQQLACLAAAKGMTDKEIEKVRKDLERRLRPTIIAPC